MKRRSFLVATSATATALALQPWRRAAAAPTDPEPRDIDGPAIAIRSGLSHLAPTVTGLTIDGTLDDPRWGDPVQDRFTALSALDEQDAVTLHLAQDGQTLYVGTGVSGAAARDVTYVSFLVRVGRSHWVASIPVRPTTPVTSFTWEGENSPIDGADSGFVSGDDLTTCTIAIPFAAIGLDPGDGTEVGLNVVVDYAEMTSPVVTSTPTRTGVNWYSGSSSRPMRTAIVDEDRYALVHLGSIAPVASGREAAAVGELGEPALEYLDFTHKRLHFHIPDATVADEVTLDWRAPGGDWERIDTTVRIARVRTAEFSHPAPLRPGQYWLRVSTASRSGADQVTHLWFDRDALIAAGDQLPANRPAPPRGDTTVTPAPASDEVTALLTLVPDRAGFTFCGVPDEPSLHPNATFSFSAAEPDRITATSTGTAYPNDDYPEDKALTVTNRLGEEVVYPYHEDGDGKRYFLSAHLWYLQRNHVYSALIGLADTDPLGAARVLHRLAEVYPGWVPTNEYPWFNRPVDPLSTPRNYYWGGSLTRWSVSDLSPVSQLAQALAAVEQTDALDVLGSELGTDVREMIINQFLLAAVDWVRTYPLTYGNMDAHNNVALGHLAKALGDSSFAHQVVEWADEFTRRSFLFDGFWKETTISYHNQSTGGTISAAGVLKGWTDGEGYESPRSGAHLTDLDLMSSMPVLAAAQRVPKLLCYPDTKVLPIADTWASERTGAPELSAGSISLGASGISRLSRGPIGSDGPYGIVFAFGELAIAEQNVEVQHFPGSGTLQVEGFNVGATVVWSFSLDQAGNFDLDLQPFHAGSYARYEITLDGTAIAEHDFHSTASGVAEIVTLARVDLDAGDHTLGFLCVGRNDQATNYKMGVNTFALLDEAARDLRDNSDPETANPSQLYLSFTPKYGHNHWDPLNLTLWAEGQELLPDIGYSHTLYGQWTKTTIGHNTVTVDSANMDNSTGVDGGSLEIFDTATPTVQAVRADYRTAYGQTTRYLREVWSIEHPDADRNQGYVLDLFRVAGGERHELSFNGDANRDAEMSTSATLSDYGPYLLPEGVEVVEPTKETETGSAEGHYYGYIYVRDVKRAELADGRFDISLTTQVDDVAASGVHLIGLAGPSTELFLGRSPSLRSTRLNGTGGDVNTEAVKYTMPKLVLRREGSELRSDFVTVLEPHAAGADPRITSVELLGHDGDADVLAVKVTHTDGTVDRVISSVTGDSTVTADGVSLTGKLGWVRFSGDQVIAMHLIGGTTLTAGGEALTDDGPVTGTVTGVHRRMTGDEMDAITTDATLPDWVEGHTLVVTHPDGKTHNYPILAVTTEGGASAIELDRVDPGFQFTEDGDSQMVFTPFTRWEGETTFRIENSVTS